MRETTEQLLNEYRKSPNVVSSSLLHFAVGRNETVYNPSVPFMHDGKAVIAGRIERGDQSRTGFFAERNGLYAPIGDAPVLELEDPFVASVRGELIVGGVRLNYETPQDEAENRYSSFQTVFYRGNTLSDLRHFSEGPVDMKDIRLIECDNGRIGVFTRPHGLEKTHGFSATIGYTEMDSLDELNADVILSAPLITDLFADGEWGGANQIVKLHNGLLGVLGHIARGEYDETGEYIRHYYPMTFALDPESGRHSPVKIIGERAVFPPSVAKSAGLTDVVFAGGIVRYSDGTAALFVGLSDAAVGKAIIKDPFVEYEN